MTQITRELILGVIDGKVLYRNFQRDELYYIEGIDVRGGNYDIRPIYSSPPPIREYMRIEEIEVEPNSYEALTSDEAAKKISRASFYFLRDIFRKDHKIAHGNIFISHVNFNPSKNEAEKILHFLRLTDADRRF